MQFQFRPSQERGVADHGWLKSFHTFSFADYYDPAYAGFGALRVINEDRVAPGTGFPTHAHREFEIFSYIVSGELSHKDSMGNVETMKRGDVQMTSGGTGIRHSEYNDNASKEVHFLQIWAKPNEYGLKPEYYTRHFDDASKTDKLVEVVAPITQDGVTDAREASGPTPVHAPLYTFASILNPGKSVEHTIRDTLHGPGQKLLYAQLIQTSGYNSASAKEEGASVQISDGTSNSTLREGDGVFIKGGASGEIVSVMNVGSVPGEFVLFEMDS